MGHFYNLNEWLSSSDFGKKYKFPTSNTHMFYGDNFKCHFQNPNDLCEKSIIPQWHRLMSTVLLSIRRLVDCYAMALLSSYGGQCYLIFSVIAGTDGIVPTSTLLKWKIENDSPWICFIHSLKKASSHTWVDFH